MQIYFHSRLCSYLPRVPILVEGTVYIYIYIEREREREREIQLFFSALLKHFFTMVPCPIIMVILWYLGWWLVEKGKCLCRISSCYC